MLKKLVLFISMAMLSSVALSADPAAPVEQEVEVAVRAQQPGESDADYEQFLYFVGGAELMVFLPSQLTLGVGGRWHQFEGELYTGLDLLSELADRPAAVPVGAKVRLYTTDQKTFYIEAEGAKYFINQNKPGTVVSSVSAAVGYQPKDLKGSDISLGYRRYSHNADSSRHHHSGTNSGVPYIKFTKRILFKN